MSNSQLKWSDVFVVVLPLVLGSGGAAVVKKLNEDKGTRPCGGKSSLEPPPWVFALAWTVLFALQGVVGLMLWRRGSRRWSTPGFKLWALLTALLVAWWPVFALWCKPMAAFLTVVAIALLTFYCVWRFWKMGKWTGKLLLPLAAWLTFASYLAFETTKSV